MYRKIYFILGIFLIMPITTFASPTPKLIPRNVLFGNPDKALVTLSPDGKYIAYIAPKNGVLNIYVAPSNKPSQAKPITDDRERGIRQYRWAYDNTHILFSRDEKGDENFRIYSYNLTTNNTKLLTPAKGVRAFIYRISPFLPQEILIGTNERDQRYFDIYKIDLLQGSKKLLLENNKYTDFFIDNDLNIRFAKFINNNGDAEYFQLRDQKWQFFMKVSLEDAMNTNIIGFSKDNFTIYLSDSRNRNTAAITSLNLITGKTKLIAEDSKADTEVLTIHPTENTIQATEINYTRAAYKVLDPSIKDDLEYLSKLHTGDLIITTRTLDDKQWLVAYKNDISPVQYYKYDRQNKKAKFLFTNRKALTDYKLASMYPVVIKSRDNLNLVNYITFPKNITVDKNLRPQQPLPLVLLVHGGPWGRDFWGLDSEHQWLADRGYAVLSVNFRGSTGFGKNFVNSANLQWGKKMHEDLIDSVNWAINNKIADPKKIAIMGGSYGGYATLVGLTFTPDVFACGVDIVGPSNILTLIKSVPAYWEPILNDFKKRIGPWDTEEQRKALLEISPLTYVHNIKKPLFIFQGANDPRVKQAESDQIVTAMRNKNIPVIYALYKDEGHGFVRHENILSHYALTEQFLAEILGGQSESIGNDLEGANFLLNDQVVVNSTKAEQLITEAIQ